MVPFLPPVLAAQMAKGLTERVLGCSLVLVLVCVVVLVLVLVLTCELVLVFPSGLACVPVLVLSVVYVGVAAAARERVLGPVLVIVLVPVHVLEAESVFVLVSVLSVVFVVVGSPSSTRGQHTGQGSCPTPGRPHSMHGGNGDFLGGEEVASRLERKASPRLFLFLGWGGGVGSLS